MATLTSTAAAATGVVRANETGVTSITATFNDATEISPSATTILMVKVPHGATIIDVIGSVSSGAATCPFDLGIQGNLSAFATAGTITSVLRATKGIPYDVSVSDDAANQFIYVTATVTPGTATSAVEVKLTCNYTMDR